MVISCDLLSNLEVPHFQTNPPWDNSAKQMGPNRPTQVRSDFCESCHFEHVYIPWKCGVFQLPRPCLIIFGGKPWKTYPRKELALGVTASGQLMGATARLQLKSKNLVNLGSAKPATDLSQDLTWYFVFFMFFFVFCFCVFPFPQYGFTWQGDTAMCNVPPATHNSEPRSRLPPCTKNCSYKVMEVKNHLGMDQYLLIPLLVGWTSIYQLFWCSPGVQGFDTLPSG